MEPKLGETIYVDIETFNSVGGFADPDGAVAPSVTVFEDATDAPILTVTSTKRGSLTGHYRAQIDLTTGNGFEAGKSYNVCATATIAAVAAGAVLDRFVLRALSIDDLLPAASYTAPPSAADIATQVEAQIMDEGDTRQVLQAIVDKINEADPDLSGLTLSAIAQNVWEYVDRTLTGGGGGTADVNLVSVNGTVFAGPNVPSFLADGVAHGGGGATLALQNLDLTYAGGTPLSISGAAPISITASNGSALSINAQGIPASITMSILTPGNGSSVHQTQDIQIFNATGGTFFLNFDDTGSNSHATAPIAWDADAAAVQAALAALPNWPGGTVNMVGFIDFRVTFATFVDYPVMIAYNSLAGTPIAAVSIANSFGTGLEVRGDGSSPDIALTGSGKIAANLDGDVLGKLLGGGSATITGVGANVAVGTNNDKTGYALAASGLDAIAASEPTAKPTTFVGWLMWLVQTQRRATKSATARVVKTEAGAQVTTQPITSSGSDETLGPPT